MSFSWKRVITVVALSVVAWVAALVISVVFSQFVAQEHPLPPDAALAELQQQLGDKGQITEEELARAERRIEELHREIRKKVAAETLSERLNRIQVHASIVSWIPWAFIVLVAVRQLQDVLAMGAVLAALLVLGLVPLPAAIVLFAAVVSTSLLKYAMLRMRKQPAG